VLTYLAMWALLFLVCVFRASTGANLLPSPNSWTLRAVYLAVATLVGLRTFSARGSGSCHSAKPPWPPVSPWLRF
jgi:hypothetical protein